MASKETFVAASPSNTQLSPCLERRESAQHLTPPGCNLFICNHVCIVAVLLDMENLGFG